MGVGIDDARRPADVPRGLAGVSVADTRISGVDGRAGCYHYRGRDAVSIAETCTVEDAWYLVHTGDLPGSDARTAFAAEVAEARRIPAEVADVLPVVAATGRPGSLDVLRSAVSVAGSVLGFRSWLEQSPEETRAQALRLAALMPRTFCTRCPAPSRTPSPSARWRPTSC